MPNKDNDCFHLTFNTKIFIFLIVCVYLMIIWHYSVNVPFWDDYDTILGYHSIVNLLSLFYLHYYYVFNTPEFYSVIKNTAPTAQDYISMLFAQHMEHRIMMNRLIELLQILMLGHINFKGLILMANLCRIGFFFFIFSAMYHKNNWFACLLLLFILQLSDWNMAFWACAALQTYVVIFLFFLTLLMLQFSMGLKADGKQVAPNNINRQRIFFLGACISAFLATFSYGNGMFVFLIGVPMLFWLGHYKKAVIFLIEGMICILLYFYKFIAPIKAPLKLKVVPYFIIFLGNLLHLSGDKLNFIALCIPFLLGSAGVILAAKLCYRGFKQNTLQKNLLFYYLVFIIMSAAADAVGRAGYFGLYEAISVRYSTYAILFFSLVLAWYINDEKKVSKSIASLMLISIVINMIYGIHSQANLDKKLNGYVQNNDGTISGLVYPNQTLPNQSLAQAAALKIYHLPVLPEE